MKLAILLIILSNAFQLIFGFNVASYNLFKKFLNNGNLNSLTFIDCNISENLRLYKILMNHYKISVINTKKISDFGGNFNLSKIFSMPYKNGFVLNMQCSETPTILRQASEGKYFTAQNYFLIFDQSTSRNLIDQLRNTNLSINSEVIIIKRTGNDIWSVYDVYNPGYERGGQLNVTKIGFWDGNNKISFIPRKYKYFERQNFNQLTLRTAVVVTEKLMKKFVDYLEDHTNNIHLDTMHKFSFCLLRNLQRFYNFSLDIKRVKSWGYLRNNVFDGMVGLMERQEIDIAGSPLYFWPERLRAIDYTIETWVSRPCFIFRHPVSRNSQTVRVVFLQPLDNSVWICLIMSVVGSIFLLRICAFFANYLKKINENNDFSNIFVSVIGIVCQQGVSFVPEFSPSRIIFLSLLLNMLMVYQFYSASIVSTLLMERPKFIKNIRNLLDSNLEMGIEDILYTRGYFNTTTDPLVLELYQNRVLKKDSEFSEAKDGVFLSPSDGLKRVQQGGYAFHVDPVTAYPIIRKTFPEYAICDLWEVLLFPVHHMIGSVAKKSPYREMITYGLRRQVETGIMKNLFNRFVPKRPECIHGNSAQTYTVKMEEFWPAFFLLCVGLIIGGWIFFIEIIYFKYHTYVLRLLEKPTKFLIKIRKK